ncbi:hypothetical protein KFL_000920190 [Klebsormidium nitens]|uniref:Uncharacterized protein n=1 Tax=Klebsormidium nitens TaxID=105231 RepID=A0A0U9HJ67_KLENI|nr:hypothetical protein KFL_000920190 [Klebsormidium nitens]|eukprot:GAQ81835.1 hypothetical protein KFL_000920190 [Klebsormidium nitens]
MEGADGSMNVPTQAGTASKAVWRDILNQLLASEDSSAIEKLGAAARSSLTDILKEGSGVGHLWPPVLKGLSVPLEISTLTSPDSSPTVALFHRRASVYMDLLQILLAAQLELPKRGTEEKAQVSDAILASTVYALIGSEGTDGSIWTNPELSRKAHEVILLAGRQPVETPPAVLRQGAQSQDSSSLVRKPPTTLATPKSEEESIQLILLAHLDRFLSKLHPTLRTKAPGSDEASFRGSEEAPRGAAILAAHQLSFIIRSIGFPALGPVINKAMPSVLTAVDHWAPPVKKQGLLALAHVVENVTVAELSWCGEVVMDALCKTAVGCDEEVWPVALPTLVTATVKIAGRDPRQKWYSHVLLLLLRDMELHYTDVPRRLVWLRGIPPLVDALRLFVVAHFKRLMPLLLTWLRAPDAETRVRTLDLLKLVILNTWPRMPAHADRLTSELRKASEASEPGHDRTEAREKSEEACQLLQRCKEHQQRCQSIEAPGIRA